jgi:hypothetical protein
MNALKKVTVYQEGNKPALHKPLLLLQYLGYCKAKRERLIGFKEVDRALINLFEKFYPQAAETANTHYPFGKLENDGFWEIEGSDKLRRTSVNHLLKSQLLEENTKAGFNEEFYKFLLAKPSSLEIGAQWLLDQYFPSQQHQGLRQAVGLNPVFNDQTTPWMVKEQSMSEALILEPYEISGFKHVAKPKPHHNGYITYLNSLHNLSANGSNALAESQALSPYFGELYEPFPLANTVRQALTTGEDKVIILTGHAGDGKSTVALDVLKALKNHSVTAPLPQSLKEREVIHTHDRTVSIVKDMSELSINQRLRWLDDAFGEQGSWLIVSNTGPLLDSLTKFAEQGSVAIPDLESQILTQLNTPHNAEQLQQHTLYLGDVPKPLVILNMTRLNNVDLGAKVLERMRDHSGWNECHGCSAETNCTLRKNRQALMDASVIDRVRWVYQRMTAYEQRLTLRQMVAHLAYSLTGGLSCEKSQHFAAACQKNSKVDEGLQRILFSESFFGYRAGEPHPDIQTLPAIKLISRIEFGSPFAVDFERQLISAEPWISFPPELQAIATHWRERARDTEGVRWRFVLRRMAYLYGQATDQLPKPTLMRFTDHFLQSPMLRQFEKWQRDGRLEQNSEQRALKTTILKVLLEVYTGFSSGQFQDNDGRLYLTLRRSDKAVVQPVQMVLASFDHDDFFLSFSASQCLPVLQYRTPETRLMITLPLMDFIHSSSLGNLGSQLAPIHLTQLEVFRAKLLKQAKQSNDELMVLRAGIDGNIKTHRFYLDKSKNRLEFI